MVDERVQLPRCSLSAMLVDVDSSDGSAMMLCRRSRIGVVMTEANDTSRSILVVEGVYEW